MSDNGGRILFADGLSEHRRQMERQRQIQSQLEQIEQEVDVILLERRRE